MKEKHITCSCGGNDKRNHPVGENGCFRYHVTDPNEIPRNRRKINLDSFKKPTFIWVWDIGDNWVTEYTLFNQRMYAQDENGNWTRPKSKDSINSL